jgi:hypothetical protein
MRATPGAPVPGTGTGHDDGDAGFVAFYERELPQQVRRAALMIGSPEAAHDLVHDAFVEVFRRWGRLRDLDERAAADHRRARLGDATRRRRAPGHRVRDRHGLHRRPPHLNPGSPESVLCTGSAGGNVIPSTQNGSGSAKP